MDTWPTLLLISVVCFSMRLIYIVREKPKFSLYKDILVYLFIIYILCLFYVVTFQDVSWSTSNFIPFKEIFRYSFGSKLFIKNVLGNMIMFIPFGFFVSYFLKLDKVYIIGIVLLITSVTIEWTQLVIGRVFDIDDIILNLVGGIIGYYIYRFVHNIRVHLPSWLQKDFVYNIIMLLFVCGIIFYLVKVVI